LSPDRIERPVTGIVAAGVVAVLGFDAVGALASKQFGFTYAFLIPGSLIIYGTVAALVARRRDWLLGLLAGVLMGLTDMTLGWTVAALIGPGRPAGGFTLATIVGGAITAFVAASLAGSVGAWIGSRRARGPSASAA